MAKKTKSKHRKKPAAKKRPTPEVVSEAAPELPASPEANGVSQGVDRVNILLLVVAALILLFAGWIVWRSVESVRDLDVTESTSSQPAIPLEGQADPNQLQSGSLPLQNQSTNNAQDNSAATLQPQQSMTPEDLQKLQ